MANLAAEVTLEWGDGEYTFALKAKQIEELEHLCDEGIGRICARVASRIDFKYRHIRETIRLALIGGGMEPVSANRLVATYVDGYPLNPYMIAPDGSKVEDKRGPVPVAAVILKAVYFGWEGLPEMPKSGEQPGPVKKQTSRSTGPHSSARGSRQSKSGK